MLCALLQYQGVPARARCGFGAHFMPGHYEDHWVYEYWKTDEGRWVMVDAQLGDFQRQALQIEFDSCDVPPIRARINTSRNQQGPDREDYPVVTGKGQQCREAGGKAWLR
jgi:hypothetical protein